ncbi:hypothetical protein FRZ67_09820 [Panacibacter ginsenosidivorans]|uniref:Uncharacterized protein n=1 Tax=Panacibacter ginsenosidivorans TaxID=1813871 RepID=A0A5B8V9N8_9BACT|nr:hypothetical protein [Panacibacter ginsenosidivorans]QEC67571.1 hypothetical protein FRZ67_09820 [Panacibacter ginsenosidivorans]
MCNCGKKRNEYSQQSNVAATQPKPQMIPAMQQNTNSVFEYTGKTALTVMGSITGRRYRFNRPGDMQSIDPRDAAGMMAVPVLQRR